VRELMDAPDDRYAIFGAGEQVHLTFEADRLPAVEPGRKRTILLRIDGWVKDNYHHTATSATVEPLPYHDMDGGTQVYPETAWQHNLESGVLREWNEEYNTRIVTDNGAF